MERLAERGIRFNQFYAMSVCSPTRISIMTGQNAARHRSTNWINPSNNNRGPQGPPQWQWKGLGKDSVSLPRLLRQRGYRTIHVGKAHFGPTGTEGSEPLNLGFDVNIAGAAFTFLNVDHQQCKFWRLARHGAGRWHTSIKPNRTATRQTSNTQNNKHWSVLATTS